jgi:hypothetical protein
MFLILYQVTVIVKYFTNTFANIALKDKEKQACNRA